MDNPRDFWAERGGSYVAGLGVILAALLLMSVAARAGKQGRRQPPWLPETIPYVTNTYHYWTDPEAFWARAGKTLEKSSVVKFSLGGMRAYVLSGSANLKEILRSGRSGIDDTVLSRSSARHVWGFSNKDVARVVRDTSGRSKKRLPGSEHVPEQDRFFFHRHHIYNEFLTHSRASKGLADTFYKCLCANLDKQPIGSSRTIGISELLRSDVTDAAIRSLLGAQVCDQHPELVPTWWDFERRSLLLFLGTPRWLDARPYKARDRLNVIMEDYIRLASTPAPDGRTPPDADAPWDERTGARVSRELLRWLREYKYDEQSITGFFSTLLLGQNGNSIALATWAVMETMHDPTLFRALQAEVRQVFSPDDAHTLDVARLLALPRLSSVYTEVLRSHVMLSLPRAAGETLVMDGFEVQKGALLIMDVGNRAEARWGAPGHPAAEFWGERHVRYAEKPGPASGAPGAPQPQFVVAGGADTFHPYGGGAAICPGRHFAKQEIFMILAVMLAKFDIEFVEWTMPDGSKSDRPARDDPNYTGAASMPPDRDMKVRLVRRW